MKKILLSGASGFVGSNLSRHLINKKYSISSLKLKTKVDIRIIEDYDVFIHLAGIAHDVKGKYTYEDYISANYKLTKELYDFFLQSNSKIFIFFSSIKAVADFSENILTEKAIPNPLSNYGKSKLLAENYILNHGCNESQKVFILRPCMIHGKNNKGNLNELYRYVKLGFPWPFGLYENKRSFCSIDNLFFVIEKLISVENIQSGIYNLADSEPLSTNEVVAMIASSQNRKLNKINLPIKLIKLLGRCGDILNLPFNSLKIEKLTQNFVVSNYEILKQINSNLPLTAKEGLAKTLYDFKEID
jgi:nucleoside-diphosphate-sugar epimerase